MKTLYIVRHAKSSWDNPKLSDRDRPLDARGEKDAPRMGKRLKERNVIPEVIYSSTAVRAYETAKAIGKVIGYDPGKIKTDSNLYHASEDTLLEFLHQIPDTINEVMLVGHNPGLTDFANDLLEENIENIPTSGMITGQLKINSWKDASWNSGELLHFDFPKKHR